jgi:uncharacterized SAM-binding protein YcdF (DUF218 family)
VTTNYLIWLIVEPTHWILWGAVLTLLCWRRPIGRWFGIATAGLVALFGLLPMGAWLLEPLETRFEVPVALDEVTGVLVLSGAEFADPTERYAEPQLSEAGDRLTTFLLLATRYPDARLVHTGSRRESPIARAVILGAGVAPNRIHFDDRSVNTCDSARNMHALIAPGPSENWLLVTSAAHMPRAVACFRAAGWVVVPYPTDFQTGSGSFSSDIVTNLGNLSIATHEWVGLLYYRLRGYTDELFPARSSP